MTGPSSTERSATDRDATDRDPIDRDPIDRDPGAHHVRTDTSGPPSAWVGWIWFAGVMVIMLGLFNLVYGLTAVLHDELFAVIPGGVLLFDLTTWGWVHAILGIAQIAVGAGILRGMRWALVLGVVLAVLNGVAQLIVLPYYPFWALIVIAVDCLVIYAIVVHGGELRRALRGV
ncbi:hypothetical protein WIS52_16620 [Pseudonocardia nematodicida]|uniref:DUF7144 domain-containing protein n=1 Tax=Pseudonocardia nematodicida TaxID=1206997 RepID=A0ABV1KCR9_9PSEU